MKKTLRKWAGPLVVVPLLSSAVVPAARAAVPTLVAYWDFNNASDAAKTADKVYGFEGTLENGAAFTGAGGGRTGTGTDRAMDFGPDSAQQLVRISKVPFLNMAAANDQITISFWEKLTDIASSSAFWGVSPSSNNGERGIQAHVPWSDSNIYFDHAGCCDAGVQRINKVLPDGYDATAWHHFAFVKNGAVKQIWIDGTLFLEGAGTAPLPKDFTRLMLGSDNGGGNSLHGFEDDFAVYAGALTPEMIASLASGTAPDKVAGTAVSTSPILGVVGNPGGFTLDITEPPGSPIQANSLSLTFDGVAVTASSVTKVGNSTTVKYNLPAGTYLASGSTHTVAVSFKDAGGATVASNNSFTVVSYATIPATAKVSPDTSKPGFIWRMFANSGNQANSTQRTEDALAGRLTAADGTLLPNNADPSAQGAALAPATAPNPDNGLITFEIATVINLSQTSGENNGTFPNDEQMPGIPQTDGSTDGVAAEIITYLELPAGTTTMGIFSDDGFKTTSGNPLDAFDAVNLRDTAGACCTEVLFNLVAEEAGVYPFRTAWEEGGGGANIEWYSVKADGTKVLIGDTAKGGIKAYRATTTPVKPYVKSVTPAPAPRQLNGVSSVIQLVLSDGSTEKVDDSTVTLQLDGKDITTTKQRTGSTLTLTYTPDGLQIPSEKHTAKLSFKGTAGTARTEEWTFLNLKSLILPTPKLLETFDSYPQDTQPTGWVAWNFTAHCADGRDITTQTSESYEDWVLTDVSNINGIDGGRPFNITPGQFIQINGKKVELLNADPPGGTFPEWIMSGNVLYAESDSRCNTDSRGDGFLNNGQSQFITTKAYDLSSYQGVVMTFSSIYEQNQDSLGAVEYSVDGGKTWLPVMYFLEEPDIRLKADGSVDAVATFNASNADTSKWVENGVQKGGKYGDGLGAVISDALSLYVVPRINDGQVEGKRVEVARLDQATGKSDVRIRLGAMGTDSWYFAIDNLAFYDIAGPVVTPGDVSATISKSGNNVTISWAPAGGTLESSPKLGAGATWTAVGTANPATIAVGNGSLFYRVKK